MWDRITAMFDNFTTGGTWGAILGAIGGALYALTTPSAIPGNEIYAMTAGGFFGMIGGGLGGAGLGAVSGLLFGSGDQPGEPQGPSPEKSIAQEVAQAVEAEEPSHGLLSFLSPSKEKSSGVGR